MNKSAQLCPFGVAGDEPLGHAKNDPFQHLIGIRQAVWMGIVSLEDGKAAYPQGDWSVIEAA